MCDNHDRIRKKCKIKLKENNRGKQNHQNKTIGENQQTKLKVIEDGCLMHKFVH